MENNKWINVENSTLISGYKYFPEEQKMHVEFKNNRAMYAYKGVPQSVAETISSVNPGTDIHVKIIKGGYEYDRIN